MNLTDALAAVAPVVGDGKLVPQHAYVYSRQNILHATDGRQWAKIDLTPAPTVDVDFCVRYDALKRALERDHGAVVSDGDNGLIVSYGRGKARLRGTDPSTWPMLPVVEVRRMVQLAPGIADRIRDLMAFCAGTDGHVWQQAVHMTPDFLFAANSFAAVKFPTQWGFDTAVGVPAWACKFIVNLGDEQLWLHDCGQMLKFAWPGIELHTTLLTEEAPENIVSFMSNLSAANPRPVPEGLKEAVARIDNHGGKTCKIGYGSITYGDASIELEDDIQTNEGIKTWGIDTLSLALEHAETIDLGSTGNAIWSGNGYIGVFGGRSD